jgi:hypothetical protein
MTYLVLTETHFGHAVNLRDAPVNRRNQLVQLPHDPGAIGRGADGRIDHGRGLDTRTLAVVANVTDMQDGQDCSTGPTSFSGSFDFV